MKLLNLAVGFILLSPVRKLKIALNIECWEKKALKLSVVKRICKILLQRIMYLLKLNIRQVKPAEGEE